MKKAIEWVKKYPFILVLIVILVFFTPFAIFSPGESRKRAIVLAVGIDKIEDKYEISFLTFIPTQNQEFTQSNSVISGIGSSVSEAVLDAQLTLGKDIGLSHAKTTVVNEKMLEEDVSASIDYLSRIASLPENTVFICTNTTAKELLIATSSLEENVGLKLDQLISYNANEVYSVDTSLEAFYKGYYGPEKSSIIGYIEHIKDEQSSQGDSSSSENGVAEQGGEQTGQEMQGGSASSDEEKQRGSLKGQSQILNRGEAVVLREGKQVAKLNVDNLNSLNLLNNKKSMDSIKIENVDIENNNNVDMIFLVKNKKIAIKSVFENNIPIFVINITLGIQLTEINAKGQKIEKEVQFTDINEEIETKVQSKLKTQFAQTLKILRDSKADIIGVYDKFYRENRAKFIKFLNSLDNKDDYLNNVVFILNLKIQPDG